MPRCGCHGNPARYSSGLSLRKSSSSRNGSNSLVSPKPNARRRCTPAPSSVGLDWMIFLTGRMDMVVCLSGTAPKATVPSALIVSRVAGLRGLRLCNRVLAEQYGELIEEAFQESPSAFIGDDVID